MVGNPEKLSALCGANDGNLRAMEDYLGAPVVSRGNELTVATSDEDVCRKFQVIVERLLSGPGPALQTPDLLAAILAGMVDDSPFSFTDSCIVIPHGTRRIYPKTAKQAELIAKFRSHEVIFSVGPAGTGKTFLAVAEALRLVLSRQVRRMVITRPVVEAGESLGFLPGDLEQKINPYLRPLYDAIETMIPPEILRRMEDSRMLEIAPLAYMRGRTLDDAVIILDEAQNTTGEQMKMFLTRLGNGSRAIITGDPTQVDLPARIESGLLQAVRIVAQVPEIAVVALEAGDVVRNPLVKKIVQAYEQEKN